ncbi:unnamed protein product [Lactuca virosa]|uniref:Tetrapyrrole biosynthesis glutamyl-tRNA reductase dimerisation domain-containing protein n=1 Tax=Lactuca virosa TaxID=75947 RepID=A0AAU9PQJ9_9ASTR|nr:unnamed protein product [Lactuca virosa]
MEREKLFDQKTLLRIEIGIKALDESRKRDQEEFLKKVEELVLSDVASEATKHMNAPKKTRDEILQFFKDILKQLIYPLILTTNDVNTKAQIGFKRVIELLMELKNSKFEEKSGPSSSKRGKAT